MTAYDRHAYIDSMQSRLALYGVFFPSYFFYARIVPLRIKKRQKSVKKCKTIFFFSCVAAAVFIPCSWSSNAISCLICFAVLLFVCISLSLSVHSCRSVCGENSKIDIHVKWQITLHVYEWSIGWRNAWCMMHVCGMMYGWRRTKYCWNRTSGQTKRWTRVKEREIDCVCMSACCKFSPVDCDVPVRAVAKCRCARARALVHILAYAFAWVNTTQSAVNVAQLLRSNCCFPVPHMRPTGVS